MIRYALHFISRIIDLIRCDATRTDDTAYVADRSNQRNVTETMGEVS